MPRVPWFSDKVKEAKRQKRKAEDKWRSSKLDADFAVFKLKRNEANNLMKQVRREFYANLIEENNDNQGKLFNICMQLFNRTNMPTFPSDVDRSSFAMGLDNYLVQKITRIRQTLNENISNGSHVPNVCITNTDSTAMSTPTFNEFKGLSTSDVASLIRSSSLKTCALDPMPSPLVSNCDALIPVITQIINASLQSGSFPEEWKEVLVLPILKKHGLDLIFKNFRPVSNL